MSRNELDAQLSALGVDFLQADRKVELVSVLVEAAAQKELRYWEVFPVLLANAAEQGTLDLAAVREKAKAKGGSKSFDELVCMSLGLYAALGRSFAWTSALAAALSTECRKQVKDYERAFKEDSAVRVGNATLAADRVKLSFQRYFKPLVNSLNGLLNKKEELGLEHALSQVFSPKQKELFLKKLKGDKFTKTENEYFSRTVRKKALALANAELHRLARELL